MEHESRIDRLSDAIIRFRNFTFVLPEIEAEISDLSGVAARMGLRLLDKGPGSITIVLRRHEFVAVHESVALLDHIVGLKKGGVMPPDMDGLRDLLKSRKNAMEASLLSAEEVDMIMIEPDLKLNLKAAGIDGPKAVQEFMARTNSGEIIEDMTEGLNDDEDHGASIFSDYVSADLPEEDREHAARKIQESDVLKRYSHDELIVISKIRHIIQKIDQYGYGIAARHRPLFTQARRNVLWSVPRIGAIMVTHLPSWKRQPEISGLLLDLRRYQQHMKDLAAIPEDDDWFNKDNALVRAVRRDAWQIHLRGVKIVSEIRSGPSAHRFDDAFFNIFPGEDANYTKRFLELSSPVINAMAFSGVGGNGERDLAMQRDIQIEEETPGILKAFRDFFHI